MSFAPIFGGFGSGGTTGSGPWTPADLSAGAALEAWFAADDLSTLFQDTGGATPVTADGDPIGRWEDKSGNGNHLTQGTGTQKPTYQTSGGLHWSSWDGSNDHLSTGSLAAHLFTSSGGWLAAAYEYTPTEEFGAIIAEQALTDFRRFVLVADTRSSPNRLLTRNVSGTDTYINYPSEQSADTRVVIANNESGTIRGYHNGASLASTVSGGELSGATRLTVGFQQGGADNFEFQGKIYELLAGSGTLSAQDITDLTAYLKGQAGI